MCAKRKYASGSSNVNPSEVHVPDTKEGLIKGGSIGAEIGGTIGKAFGPLAPLFKIGGAALGATIGGVTNAILGNDAREYQQGVELANRIQSKPQNTNMGNIENRYGNLSSIGNFMFQQGTQGVSQSIPIEVEKDELVFRLDKMGNPKLIADFKGGKNHYQGGEQFVAQEGDIIFPGKKRDEIKKLIDKQGNVIDMLRFKTEYAKLPADNNTSVYEDGGTVNPRHFNFNNYARNKKYKDVGYIQRLLQNTGYKNTGGTITGKTTIDEMFGNNTDLGLKENSGKIFNIDDNNPLGIQGGEYTLKYNSYGDFELIPVKKSLETTSTTGTEEIGPTGIGTLNTGIKTPAKITPETTSLTKIGTPSTEIKTLGINKPVTAIRTPIPGIEPSLTEIETETPTIESTTEIPELLKPLTPTSTQTTTTGSEGIGFSKELLPLLDPVKVPEQQIEPFQSTRGGFIIPGGRQSALELTPQQVRLNRLKYLDTSDPSRREALQQQTINNQNIRNTSAGNAGMANALMQRAGAMNTDQQLRLNALENQRKLIISNQNTTIENQEALTNNQLINNANMYNVQDRSNAMNVNAAQRNTQLNQNFGALQQLRQNEINKKYYDIANRQNLDNRNKTISALVNNRNNLVESITGKKSEKSFQPSTYEPISELSNLNLIDELKKLKKLFGKSKP